MPRLPDEKQALILAETWRRITPRLAKDDGSVWYQGGEPYMDLFFQLDASQPWLRQLLAGPRPSWFQLTIRGRTVTWDGAVVTTGTTDEFQPAGGFPSSNRVFADRTVDGAVLALARTLLSRQLDDPLFRAALDALS